MTSGRDYALTGPEGRRAIERGLAEATWYESPIPRPLLKELMARTNARAARDTLLWLVLLIGSGIVAHLSWGTWWAIPAFAVYGTLYGSTCDARWHECGHATAFATRWPNDIVYPVASFMAFREPVSWRWSHTRHHDDTIVVGRDKEIAVKRPTALWRLALELVAFFSVKAELGKLGHNLRGRVDPEDRGFIPESDQPAAIRSGRIMVALLIVPVVASVAVGSAEPVLFMGILPSMYGRWLLVVYGLTQHAGLAEDVLDHRLNTRTVRMNALNRFLYSNMNYHIEHHMYPTVPYYQLPRLHEAIKDDLRPVYDGLRGAYREIIPALRRQAKDPAYFVQRTLPEPLTIGIVVRSEDVVSPGSTADGDWVDVCLVDDLAPDDVLRFDIDDRTYAVYRTADSRYFATDGRCTHGRAHLSTGFLSGTVIECGKHNGRFDITTGAALGAPVLVDLGCHQVRMVDGTVQLKISGSSSRQTPA